MHRFHLRNTLHQETLLKFLFLMGVLGGYFFYLSMKFDFATGGLLTALTWSFFVLCTPVADAGFLLDFPIRLIAGIRMWVTELIVWGIAVAFNIYGIFFQADVYQSTFITKVFYQILVQPYPYWGLIGLCCIGTFLSIYFGDEVMDVIAHRHREKFQKHNFKYKVILIIFLFVLIIWGYKIIITDLGLVDLL